MLAGKNHPGGFGDLQAYDACLRQDEPQPRQKIFRLLQLCASKRGTLTVKGRESMKLSFEQKDGGLYIRTDADGAARRWGC